ncbi:hypothetical protein AMQ83_28340 [Paenibacillus riograndensis]|nr:hypothetical protein AMQ83_28340 [Paenibacillus riograndensis]
MKKRSGLVIAVKLVFVLSLCVLLYSAFQILKAPVEARQALQEWEKKREEAPNLYHTEEEAPLHDGIATPS